ncbi:MAG: helix-turn-helix domain-containing protein [Anaerotignum sp.]
MKEMGQRLRTLRESMKLSQVKMGELLGLKQSSINRYEQGTATPTVENLRKYADYFDVSMDYIFARTDNPQGKLYEHQPKLLASSEEMQQFIEMCFDPESPYNERLKETMIRMIGEMQK